jgi:hypothetical protein
MLQYFGLAAGIIAIVSHIPYFVDIVRQTTKPERASWFIWTVLGSIAFVTQLVEGASSSLWLTGMDSIGVLLTFILAVKFGTGGLSKRDMRALIAAGIGLILWYITKHASIALLITIFVDLTGTVLTVIKSYEDPESETLITWLGVSLAGLLAMISVGKFNLILLVYPFYIFSANFAVVVAMVIGKRKNGKNTLLKVET